MISLSDIFNHILQLTNVNFIDTYEHFTNVDFSCFTKNKSLYL